ncbi:hypothetical protein CUMW_256310 [Citrus unshiu]|nr:hypothetical protein CUMW_256310 [Citrus unshiu]
MGTPCAVRVAGKSPLLGEPVPLGYTDWSEGVGPPFFSLIADDEINGNIDLLVVPQYGRNLDHTG